VANHVVVAMSPKSFERALSLSPRTYKALTCYVAWTQSEIIDPSDTSKKLGFVQFGKGDDAVTQLTDAMCSDATNGKISPKSFQHAREDLHQSGDVALKLTGKGFRLIVRDSDKFNDVTRTATNGYAWVLSLPEFSRPARVPEMGSQQNMSPQNGESDDDSGESEVISGDSGVKTGDSGALNDNKTQGDTSLHKKNKHNKKNEPPTFSLSSKPCGQELLIWLAGQGLNLLPEQQSTVKDVAKRYSLPVLKRAATACLSGLTIGNSWDHCEKKLAANLELQAQVVLREDEKARKTQEMIVQCTANEQEKVRQELAEMERQRAEEAALVEDTLGCTENG
jgi:hypothetical protein